MDKLVTVLTDFAAQQVAAGADVIQVFDSWVGALSLSDYRDYALAPTTELIRRIQALGVPVIYFGVDTATLLPTMRETGCRRPRPRLAHPARPGLARPRTTHVAVQGNLDPITLFAPEDVLEARVPKSSPTPPAAPATSSTSATASSPTPPSTPSSASSTSSSATAKPPPTPPTKPPATGPSAPNQSPQADYSTEMPYSESPRIVMEARFDVIVHTIQTLAISAKHQYDSLIANRPGTHTIQVLFSDSGASRMPKSVIQLRTAHRSLR